MLNLKEILKPASLDEAARLLQQPGTIALAGGTGLIADASRRPHTQRGPGQAEAAVDLSALGLAYLHENDGTIAIGAMTTLAQLAESPIARSLAGGILAQAAHRSAASILRNQATVAGTLIGEPDSLLAVALLALDAHVTIMHQGVWTAPLADFLPMRKHLLNRALLTEIVLPVTKPRASLQTVERTPSDKPIVGVCAVARIRDGRAQNVRIALCGVREVAVRAGAAEQALKDVAFDDAAIGNAASLVPQGLSPQGDVRGSGGYRLEMAVVLTLRALRELAV